jgi:hypothetical protein
LADLLRQGRALPASALRTSLVIITPSAEGEWIEALLPLLEQGAAPTVLLLDPVSYGGSSDMGGTMALLTDLGVARYLLTRDLFDRPEARPGREGQWEWRVFPTGHVVLMRRPRDLAWKRLS